MADTATDAATKIVAFTARLDGEIVGEMDRRAAKLAAELGFDVSRNDYIAHICRRFWDLEDAQKADKT